MGGKILKWLRIVIADAITMIWLLWLLCFDAKQGLNIRYSFIESIYGLLVDTQSLLQQGLHTTVCWGCCSLTVGYWKPVTLFCKLDNSICVVKNLLQLGSWKLCNSRWSFWRLSVTVNVGNTHFVMPLMFCCLDTHERERFALFLGVSNLDWEISSFPFSSKMKNYFVHLEFLLHIHSFTFLNSYPFPFLHLLVIAQIYGPTTCLIPRLPEWRRQMSCFWLAPIHALRHHFLMLEFERGLYSLAVSKHANPSGFDAMLWWSCRQ